jgi:hypothetical protein
MMLKIYPDSYRADGELRTFRLDGQRLVVDEVIDHWYDGKYQYLTLLADDERIYLLKHDGGDYWQVERIYGY